MRPDGPRDPLAGPDSGPEPPFPIKLSGPVIKGFGRGSKEVHDFFLRHCASNRIRVSQVPVAISIPCHGSHRSSPNLIPGIHIATAWPHFFNTPGGGWKDLPSAILLNQASSNRNRISVPLAAVLV